MSEIIVNKDSKLIKVLAADARHERLDSNVLKEANDIVAELVSDLTPANRHQIAQTVAFTVNDLQQHELDFLNTVADIKNISYGDKAAFKVQTKGIKAYIQAKGSTTARSYVAEHQVLVDTMEISARPAINIVDLRCGRVNMADLIREANKEMTNKKLVLIEKVLQDAIDDYSTPFYAMSTGGLNKAALDQQLLYFRRLGPVDIIGDIAAVSQIAPFTGMAMSATQNQYSDNLINEMNDNAFIGKYQGMNVIAMTNTYEEGQTTPILNPDWLYIIPGGMTGDARNLKVVNEGTVNAFESQNIDDLTYEIRLDQWFGAAFVTGRLPTLGAHEIN